MLKNNRPADTAELPTDPPQTVTKIDELLNLLQLTRAQLPAAVDLNPRFPLRVPRNFIERMRKGDPHDPLLRQVLPTAHEYHEVAGYSPDPLDEMRASPQNGLLHKYGGRVLMILSGSCGIHCRYCFRRHFPYTEHVPATANRQAALAYIASDTTLREVILSGGDPLCINNTVLHRIIKELAGIAHLKRIRIHSRLPIIFPEKANDALLNILTATRLKTIMVVHANHAHEIDHAVAAAMSGMAGAGIALLNQSVLLKGVNDRVADLKHLSEALFETGVLPYYLHMPDKVAGTAHFRVSQTKAKQLVRQLMQVLPGYLVPRLVKERAGSGSKILLCPWEFVGKLRRGIPTNSQL